MTGMPPLSGIDAGPDRLPPLDPAALSPAQAEAVEAIASGPRGGVIGPFIPMLRSPELMDRTQRLGEFLRYRCSVPERLREWAIIVTARCWRQAFEWQVHAPLAHKAGVSAAAIAELAAGETPLSAAEDERTIHAFCAALHLSRGVDDALYAQAVALLGEQGTVELTGLCGYYAMLAMMLNMARTPAGGPPFAVPA